MNSLIRFPITLQVSACLFAMLISSCGVNQVVPAGNAKLESKGASYYLPLTVVVANVPVEKTVVSPGDFAFYSEPLLRTPADMSASSTKFAVGDAVTLDLVGEKDPSQRYIALYPKGPFKTFTQTLTLNDQGVLTKGEATVENKTVEFAVSTLEAAAKIAGSAIKPAGAGPDLFPERSGLEALLKHVNGLDESPAPDLTMDGLRAGLAILLSGDPDVKLATLEKTDALKQAVSNWKAFTNKAPKGLSEMVRATQAYKQLVKLTDMLNEQVQNAADRAAVKADRDDVLGSFMGKKSKTTWVGQFRWTPPSRDSCVTAGAMQVSHTILKVNETQGITSISNAETPPGASMKKGGASSGTTFSVSLICESSIPEQTATWQSLAGERKMHGWYYRIPAQSKIVCMVNSDRRITKRCAIAQHGCTAFLPATSAGQKVVSNIDLDPVSGALKSTTFGGTSFDPGLVNRTGSAISSVIDADKAAQKAEAVANDPVTQLQRKKNLLQLTKDVQALEGSATP